MLSIKTSEFQCGICWEVPNRNLKIYMCNSGHDVCEACYEKLESKICSTCRGSFSQPPIRNRKLEGLIEENLEFACKYKQAGCSFKGVSASLDLHEAKCPFEEIQCVLPLCQWPMLRQDIEEHFSSMHISCMEKDNGCNFTGSSTMMQEHAGVCPFKIQDCPLKECAKKLTASSFLNHLLNEHMDSNDGCSFVGTTKQVAEHVTKCQYEKISCPWKLCQDLLPMKDLIKHLKEKHKLAKFMGEANEGICQNDYFSWSAFSLKIWAYDGEKFLTSLSTTSGGHYEICVYILGDDNLASKYKVDIEARGWNHVTLTKRGLGIIPLSQHVTPHRFLDMHYFMISQTTLKDQLDQFGDGIVNFKYTIKKNP